MIDPFTRASAPYQNAMRHPFKTGSAYEGWKPKEPSPALVIGIATAIVAAILVAVYVCGVMS